MEIESYSYSGQDPRGDPLCNTTCKLRCADIDLAQTESWLARQVSCLTADGRVSAPPLAQTADALNVSLLYHRGHLQPPTHLSVGRCATWSHVDALSVCSWCRLFNYLPHCRYCDEDYKSKSSQFRGKRRHLTWVACPVPAHVAQWAELELRPDLDIAPAVSCVYVNVYCQCGAAGGSEHYRVGVPDADDSLVLVLNVSLVSGPLVCNANIVRQTCVVWEIY